VGLVSAAELQVETAQDVAEILSLYQNEGFGFSDLMIRQAAKLAGVTLIGTSH
jgi:predicted nucleic-acid-binding protein